MKTHKRVGVVEIGSRSVRLLVAEVSSTGNINVLKTNWKETNLESAINKENDALVTAVRETKLIVEVFRQDAVAFDPCRITTCGTQAVRSLVKRSKSLLDQLKEGIPETDFMTLSRKSEAWCSFLAAFGSLPKSVSSRQEILMIDQGSGSIELALGQISDTHIELFNHQGHPLGTQSLVKELRVRNGDIYAFQKSLQEKVDGYQLIDVRPSTPAVVLGSAATKLAWLQVRKYTTERYSPNRVDGVEIPLETVHNLIKMTANDPEKMQRVVDPNHPNSDEYKTLVTGMIELLAFLGRFGISKFIVSGRGTRYGIAWALAYGNPKTHRISRI